jgi:hypothetical protein
VRAGATLSASTSGVASAVTLMGGLFVLLFGVVATSGVYGSRLAWLLGVALPLLAVTVLLAWLSLGGAGRVQRRLRVAPGDQRDRRDQHDRVSRGVLLVAGTLLGLPLAGAAVLLLTYALLFVAHGVSPLV